MIRFHLGEVKTVNGSVQLGRIETPENKHEAFIERDAEGNLDVTFDGVEPEDGTPVTMVNIRENNSTYTGVIQHAEGGELIFKG